MIKSGSELASPGEADLIEAIRQVRFGELYGVEVQQGGGQWVEIQSSAAIHDLLLYIRSGIQHIDVLTIHNGQPALAETDCKINGFHARIKVKFPTIPTEG